MRKHSCQKVEFIMIMTYILVFSFFTLAYLNAFDLYSTTILIEHGAFEVNPYVKWIIDHHGIVPGLLMYKIINITILGFMVYKAVDKNSKFTKREYNLLFYGIIIATVFYLYIMIFYNLKNLLEVI